MAEGGRSVLPPRAGGGRAAARDLRWLLLTVLLLVLAQASVGMVVNLFVTVPEHHAGAVPSNYFTGSAASVRWAITHGVATLAVHAALGLAVVVVAVVATIRSARCARRGVTVAAAFGTVFIVGAGFNGASFLDFGHDVSSLIMALLAFAAAACFGVSLFALAPRAGGN